jgi:hypothetical protein
VRGGARARGSRRMERWRRTGERNSGGTKAEPRTGSVVIKGVREGVKSKLCQKIEEETETA